MLNEFGKELGEFLEYKNISIKEFAERVNTTSKNMIDIIKGNVELSQNMIYNIAFVTEIPVSYIENVERSFKMDKVINSFIDKKNISIRKFINLFNYKEFSKEYEFMFTDVIDDYDGEDRLLIGMLRWLYVAEEFRNRGAADALMEEYFLLLAYAGIELAVYDLPFKETVI